MLLVLSTYCQYTWEQKVLQKSCSCWQEHELCCDRFVKTAEPIVLCNREGPMQHCPLEFLKQQLTSADTNPEGKYRYFNC